jgi:hypothetical protein
MGCSKEISFPEKDFFVEQENKGNAILFLFPGNVLPTKKRISPIFSCALIRLSAAFSIHLKKDVIVYCLTYFAPKLN